LSTTSTSPLKASSAVFLSAVFASFPIALPVFFTPFPISCPKDVVSWLRGLKHVNKPNTAVKRQTLINFS
jgi:hypothetical protein